MPDDRSHMLLAAEKLMKAVLFDEAHGGLLSPETIRAADELRVLLLRFRELRLQQLKGTDPTNV